MDPLMDHDAFDGLMTSLDPPLVVVTTAVGEERGGCLVGFHAQSSIEPARYCIWLSKANHTYRLGLRATHLGINFLTEDQLPLAERFGTLTGDDVDKFEDVAAEVGVGEVPLLVDGADHVCVTTEPVTAESSGPFRPLRLSAAADLVPGHGNEERKLPPTERASS